MADTSPRPQLRPGPTKTGRMTVRNRPVWQNPLTKEIYSEKTVTIPWGTGYATVPSVDGQGNELSREELYKRIVNVKTQLSKKGPVDFITGEDLPVFDTEEDAIKYAMWRSSTMFDKEAAAQGFQLDQYELAPEKEDPSFLYDMGSYGKKIAGSLGALGLRKLGFDAYPTENSFSEGGVSMLPAVDDDRTPSKPRDTFNPLAFAKESWESAKENFRDAGVTEVDLDDPALYNGYIRAVDYLKDSGLAGLDLIDAAAKAVIGTAGELVTRSDASQRRFQRDIYSMPEAFAGAAGARSVTQLDDAIEAGAESARLAKAASGPLAADAVGQTRALLSGDTEFLRGTPTDRATTQSLSAGFTGQNPPTYIPKGEPVFDPKGNQASVDNRPFIAFREPVAEFTRKLTMTNSFPSKGMTGAEFLRLLEKNAESIPPSSYKEGLVDKNKRYSREELLDAVTKGPPSRPRGGPESLYYSIAELDKAAYEGFQRQSGVGFEGGVEMPGNSYFAIPIIARTSGAKFLAKSQHFGNNTTAHVRGSIMDPMVGYNNNPYLSEEFKEVVGTNPYLLVEEIQSDLLQKGYVRPKNSFDQAWNATTNQFDSQLRDVTYEELYGPIDNEISKIIKELDEEGLNYPRSEDYQGLDYRTYDLKYDAAANSRFLRSGADRGFVTFDLLAKRIKEDGRLSDWWEHYVGNLSSNNINLVTDEMSGKVYTASDLRNTDKNIQAFEDFENYLKEEWPELSYDFVLEKYENDLDKYAETVESKIDKYGLSSEIETEDLNFMYRLFKENKATQDKINDTTALPPVRKNKQTVEEGLKILIAKADQKGVDKIVIPPASKIAEARNRTIDPSDKGDRFYRTYVTDLNKALEDLEKNYPVTIHRDVELPYRNKNQPTRTAAEQHLIDMGFEDMVNDNPNAVAANAVDDAAINDDDLFTVEEGNQFFDLPEGFFDDVPDQQLENLVEITEPLGDELLPPSKRKKLVEVDNKGIIIDISKLREQFQVDKPRQFARGGMVEKQMQDLFAGSK